MAPIEAAGADGVDIIIFPEARVLRLLPPAAEILRGLRSELRVV